MEIDVSKFFQSAAPRDYSASVAEIGRDAGPVTWQHACEDSAEYLMLDTDEKREAFRGFVESSGGWTREEIDAWADSELNALLIQWIAGDCRECFPDCRELSELTAEDWEAAYEDMQQGHIPSNLFRAEDGTIYFYAGC